MPFRRLHSINPSTLLYKLPQGTRQVIAVASAGGVVGLVAVTFHWFVEGLYSVGIERASHLTPTGFLLTSFFWVMSCSLLASLLVHHFAPEASGGGVMPTKMAFWKDFGVMPLRTAVVKFIASGLTLGGGVSMGPEGPSVQIGASTASAIATQAGTAKQQHRIFCAAGAAAAIAAAFNAPLAAILFVLEEIIGDLNTKLISGILLAAVAGSLVAHAFIGPQPAYQVAELGNLSWKAYLLCIPCAMLATVLGVCFQKGAMAMRRRLKGKDLAKIPNWIVPCLGGLASWVIGAAVFLSCGELGIFGIGYHDITQAISNELSLKACLLLMGGKLLATLIAVGTAGCGGIFAPSFFIGAMSGAVTALLAGFAFHLSPSDHAILVLVGMCASLGAVIRTPLTSIFLIFEVTHQFPIIPFAVLATLTSQLLARRLQHEGMYEEMLRQDGHNPERVMPPRDYSRWKSMHVGSIAQYEVHDVPLNDMGVLDQTLRSRKYGRFPARGAAGELLGVARREELEALLKTGQAPRVEAAKWVRPSDTLEQAQAAMLDSPSDFLFVGDEASGQIEGIVTLHDILRTQQRLGDDGRG